MLLRLPLSVLKRTVSTVKVADVEGVVFPAFVKSCIPKLIRSRVYGSSDELSRELRGLEPTTDLLVSEIVELQAEARSWTLGGEVLSIACYEGDTKLEAARTLASAVAGEPAVTSPCVIDLGLTRDRGWVVIEANAAWGAGLNGCDALAAARCIAQATRPAH